MIAVAVVAAAVCEVGLCVGEVDAPSSAAGGPVSRTVQEFFRKVGDLHIGLRIAVLLYTVKDQ